MSKFYRNKIKNLIRPGYYFCKDFFDFAGNKRLGKNIQLKNLHEGERVFLLLSGESLEHVDIKKLKNEYIYGAGYTFFHEDIRNIDLNYYMSADSGRIFRPGLPQWPQKQLGPLTREGVVQFYRAVDNAFAKQTTLILNSDNYNDIESNGLFQGKNIHYIKVKKDLDVEEGASSDKMVDLTKRSVSGGGSVFFSILILMYMGFKEIYLCGAGYTYEPVYVLHFYDNYVFPKSMGRRKAETEARKAIDGINKKHSSNLEYYGFFEKDDLYRSVCVIKKDHAPPKDKHRILNNYVRSQGVKIYNIVPDGFESPIYEKITWQEVESKILPGNQKPEIP